MLALVTDAPPDGMAPPELPLPPQDFAAGLVVIHGLPVMPSGIPFWDEATADLGLPSWAPPASRPS